MAAPAVVHISGSPGSGKTRLGRQLAGPTVALKDTDEFFDGAPESIWNSPQAWLAHVDAHVTEFLEKHRDKRTVVFVGILDSVWGGAHVFYEFKKAHALFFLDVPITQLLRQFYARYAERTVDWERVASGERPIPSSREKVLEYEDDLREHVARNYRVASRNAIAAHVMQQQQQAEAFHSIRVRVGETFKFRYYTSAQRSPQLVLSDGLRTLEDYVVTDNDKPGGSILREASILARRAGRESVTLRARDEPRVTDVIVE